MWISVPGSVRRDESVPVQRQSPGPEGLPAQRPELLRGSHVPVRAPHPHPALRAEVSGQDAQPVAALHPHAGAAGLREGPEPAQQAQAQHRVLRTGEHHAAAAGTMTPATQKLASSRFAAPFSRFVCQRCSVSFPQEILDSLAELYSLLQEEDMWAGLWQKRCKFPETATAIAYEQHGFFEQVHLVILCN